MDKTQYNSFVSKLQEIFMMDHAELDFGIYRIMNFKRKEINDFLTNKLLPQVETELKKSLQVDSADIKEELDKAIAACIDNGFNPDESKKVQELRAKLASSANLDDMQSVVFSRLTQFFSRYYKEGDFISQRRYKSNGESSYMLPYNGEEVKLVWANQDQYYIKTSEYFKNYTFILPNSRNKVHFVLKDASTEQNNNKNQNGMERRFALYRGGVNGEEPLAIVSGELEIYFTYELMPKATKQKDLIAKAYGVLKPLIESDDRFKNWKELLMNAVKADRSLMDITWLQKHLNDYTAKNSFDYFIHKDLGGFLRRELDFFIKNEVLVIDDLTSAKMKSTLAIVKAIEQVGNKIITFLAQLEDFQKKLWLKKKFVVGCDYCITLDRIPESMYSEIIANDEQRKEWVRLFAIDEIKGDLATEAYSEPLTIEFLKQNPFLVLDTKFFYLEFKHKLLATMENIDGQCNGLLVNSENFQGMNLLFEKYKNSIDTVITDPPYNTGDDGFLYKDNYADSSWITMMNDRVRFMYILLKVTSWCSFNINDIELFNLMEMMKDYDWSSETNITVKMSHLSGMKMSHIDKKIPKIKESIEIFSKGNDYKLNPVYEPCDWDEAFERYTSWVDFHGTDDPSFWSKKTVREAAKEQGIDINDKTQFDKFRITNADHIYRTAVNDSLAEVPKDGRFHSILTSQGLHKIAINGEEVLFAKNYLKNIDNQLVPAQPKGDIWTDIGINNAHNEGGVQLPNGKKPVKLYERLVSMLNSGEGLVMDPFAGSATTAHAVIENNKKGANNKYILLQEGYNYFNEKTKKRVENVIYSSEWKLDQPVSRQGISQCFKYIRLEQYEDTLNNLVPKQSMPAVDDDFQESYMLGYMLDTDTRGSLLNLKMFKHPFNVKIKTTKDNELVDTPVDMVETFNYLIGLNVETESWHHGGDICVVEGKTHIGNENTLVIWRDCEKIDNDALNEFFRKQDFNTLDMEYDVIYVNGDNTLPNVRRDEDHWKVVLTEDEFKARMFEED